jgi:hypothetical protein
MGILKGLAREKLSPYFLAAALGVFTYGMHIKMTDTQWL